MKVAVIPETTNVKSTAGGSGVGFAVGFGVGLGVGFGVGTGVGAGVAMGRTVGRGVGFGVALAGFGVAFGDATGPDARDDSVAWLGTTATCEPSPEVALGRPVEPSTSPPGIEDPSATTTTISTTTDDPRAASCGAQPRNPRRRAC